VKPVLKLDGCSYEAAKYAVEHWHYSGRMLTSKAVKIGVWENDVFIGCVIFSRGANNHIGRPYALAQTEVCELTRVALTTHQTPVSRIISIAIRLLKSASPGLRLIVSYADEQSQGHHGGVYQSGNWLYVGQSQAQRGVIVNGAGMHKRTASRLFGTIEGLEKSDVLWKHKYLYALDETLRRKLESLRQPYPKRTLANKAT